ncbi:alpha/beta hydrolase family protein [Pseudarthrobacter sp. P1]|uniref:alpha/beta hydrolase family protein n=1 Tax=Pseudarthrobacter sp. P1 TaxID=3418418 RepID=UPI003CF299B4
MATTLVPAIHERIAQCTTSILVERLVPGAQLVVSVDGTEYSAVASGASVQLAVPPLAGGAVVRAKQDAGSGFTPWSADVEVEDALLPPITSPRLPEEVGACSQCVHVSGLVPGAVVELALQSSGGMVGTGTADGAGTACVDVDLSANQGKGADVLGARIVVCGQPGPPSSAPVVASPRLAKPQVLGPLFGCQRMVPTSNLTPGARVRFEMGTDDLGNLCSCSAAVNAWFGSDLVAGRQVRAVPYWDSVQCSGDGPPSAWVLVVPPDGRIKPVVLPALVAGDRTIRVGNQIANATVVVRIRPDEHSDFEEFGPAATSENPEFGLNAPLAPGNVVTVVQTLCTVAVESDPVTVLPGPAAVLPPVVVPPVNRCGAGMLVANLHQGALVRVFADGIPVGTAWAGDRSSIEVPANVAAHMSITATQFVGGVGSLPSSPPVEVGTAAPVVPRILEPVATGDHAVWVSHVTPGVRVTVWSGTVRLGSAEAAEPVVQVPVAALDGPVHATALLCGELVQGPDVAPIAPPSGAGGFSQPGEEPRMYADFPVPAAADGGAFPMPIQGQLYFPSNDGKTWPRGARNVPLVVIAHGYWAPGVGSYLGYDYLGRHLARWGMAVFSLNLDAVNAETHFADPHQFARGEIILHTIDALAADPGLAGKLDTSRVGLVGHSMGGEGVVLAQHLNAGGARGYGIRGVVSIAPTNYRTEVSLRDAKYLQLLGSMDLLSRSLLGSAWLNGFRIYDRAFSPKTHAWIYGARHNPFNRKWLQAGDTFEAPWADAALPPSEHENIARTLVNAFFQDALFGRHAYAGYLEGTVVPQSLRQLELYVQHRHEPRTVIDNFGDVDEQASLAAQPLDKTANSLALPAAAEGSGLLFWDDVQHTASGAATPHETQSTELSWNPPSAADARYGTGAGGPAATPRDAVSFRVGQFYPDASLNPAGAAADLLVTLDDGGQQATVRAGAIGPIPYPDVRDAAAGLCPMRTIRIPLDAFTAANAAFDPEKIQRIIFGLTARPTGRIFVDDIEITS